MTNSSQIQATQKNDNAENSQEENSSLKKEDLLIKGFQFIKLQIISNKKLFILVFFLVTALVLYTVANSLQKRSLDNSPEKNQPAFSSSDTSDNLMHTLELVDGVLMRYDPQTVLSDGQSQIILKSGPPPYPSDPNLRHAGEILFLNTVNTTTGKYSEVFFTESFYLELKINDSIKDTHYMNLDSISIYYLSHSEEARGNYQKIPTALNSDNNVAVTNSANSAYGIYRVLGELKCPEDYLEPDDDGPDYLLNPASGIDKGKFYSSFGQFLFSEIVKGYFTHVEDVDWLAFSPSREKKYQIKVESLNQPAPRIEIYKNYSARTDLILIESYSTSSTDTSHSANYYFQGEDTAYPDNYLEVYVKISPQENTQIGCESEYQVTILEL